VLGDMCDGKHGRKVMKNVWLLAGRLERECKRELRGYRKREDIKVSMCTLKCGESVRASFLVLDNKKNNKQKWLRTSALAWKRSRRRASIS
jgi:hypothetical protein